MSILKIGFLVFISLYGKIYAAELYKYKDDNGKWIFTDKKPAGNQDVNTLQYAGNKKALSKPKVYIKNFEGKYTIAVHNPYYAPVEIEVYSSIFKGDLHRETIAGASTKILYESTNKIPHFRYKWRVGDPMTRADDHPYMIPISSKASHKITQSFNGRFSHSKTPSIYAVDIATPVGTYISAARGGTVIWVKDDYYMGGKDKYFLDKANYVKVLHQDGTYALYAHILLDSALVKPGDNVVAGDKLARAGSSGYSTGPHLHFVIRKNTGLKTVSIPFKFINNEGVSFKPQRGMKLDGVEKIN